MSNFKLVAQGLDVKPLVDALESRPELWKHITARQIAPGSAHHDTEAIFLRWCAKLDVHAAFNELEAVDFRAALELPEAVELVKQALQHIPHEAIGRILIVNLKAGGSIDAHMDEGAYADHYDRFHISLQSDEGNIFHVGGKSFHALPGELWWFNHKQHHSVENKSGRDRLHLILDVVAPEYRAMRGIYFQREMSQDLWPEIGPLLEQHYDEVAKFKDIPLEPDVDAYNAMEEAGKLRCFTARDCGKLIGYVVFICGSHLHYKSLRTAMQDVLFLSPEARKGTTALRFFDFFEKRLQAEGWHMTLQHQKPAHPALGVVCQRRGYEVMDIMWAKRLDKDN